MIKYKRITTESVCETWLYTDCYGALFLRRWSTAEWRFQILSYG